MRFPKHGLFLLALLPFVLADAWGAPQHTVEAARKRTFEQLNLMSFRVKMLHHEARSSILVAMELPFLEQYFALPSSKQNQYDELGQLQVSTQQDRMRQNLEQWVLQLHDRFPIAETCLIDKTGQEHMRVVGHEANTVTHFSSEEASGPFFGPAMGLEKGEVHLSRPYMSPDALEWVFAVASPIVTSGGDRPGLYHYEIPLSVYQSLIKTTDFDFVAKHGSTLDLHEEGRYIVLNDIGLVLADSEQLIRYQIPNDRNPYLNPEISDYLPPEKLSDYFPTIDSVSTNVNFLRAIEQMKHLTKGILDFDIDGQVYILAFEKLAHRGWYVMHLDPVGADAYWKR